MHFEPLMAEIIWSNAKDAKGVSLVDPNTQDLTLLKNHQQYLKKRRYGTYSKWKRFFEETKDNNIPAAEARELMLEIYRALYDTVIPAASYSSMGGRNQNEGLLHEALIAWEDAY